MGEKINVLIADDNVDLSNLLKDFISRQDDMKVVGMAADGIETLEMIRELCPDVVILDLIMPNLDGLGVLEKYYEIKSEDKPMFIVLSAIGQDGFIKRAISLGAEYYIIKPFDASILVSRIRQIFNERHKPGNSFITVDNGSSNIAGSLKENSAQKVEADVTNLMWLVGISAHISGYKYIREAILYCIENPEAVNSCTKTLYPYIAEKFKVSTQKVERSIRNAIDKAWKEIKPGVKNSIFGPYIGKNEKRPKNSEFIAMVSDRIRMGIK